jgi:hypothetical protein
MLWSEFNVFVNKACPLPIYLVEFLSFKDVFPSGYCIPSKANEPLYCRFHTQKIPRFVFVIYSEKCQKSGKCIEFRRPKLAKTP